MTPAPPLPPPTPRALARLVVQLLLLLRPYWRALIKGALLGPVIGLTSIVPPYLTKLIYDEVAVHQDVSLLQVLVGGGLAVSLATLLAQSLLGYYSSYLHVKLENTAVLHLFNHLQHLPDTFFSRRQSGDILSRFGDMKGGLSAVSGLLQLVFGEGLYLLLVPPLLLVLQWKLALVALVTVPISVLVPIATGRVLGRAWQRTVGAYAAFESLQVETLRQLRTTKTLALEHFTFVRASRRAEAILGAHLHAQGVENLMRVVERTLELCNLALFTWLGWHFILAGEMSLGDFVAFAAYVGYLRGPFHAVIGLLSSLPQRGVNLQRVFECLEHPPEQDPQVATRPPEPLTHRLEGGIVLEAVSFGYTPTVDVLHGLDARLEPGRVVAIVGPSGSGKTTLLRLLTRLEEPRTGRIRFDGHDARDLPLSELRRQLAVVWQEVELFHGTLRENLTLGLPETSDAQVEEAVRLCGLEGLLASLPAGYETMVAEWGASLSGGQRQRIALARALLRDAPILLLDEATANIDMETEAAVVDALLARARARKQTVVFVTHRMANATLADEVWLIAGGLLEARGTHTELLSSSPRYARLYRLAVSPGELGRGLAAAAVPVEPADQVVVAGAPEPRKEDEAR